MRRETVLSSSHHTQSLVEPVTRNQQLPDASCTHDGRDRSQCVHTVHCFPQCIPKSHIMKETVTKLPYVRVWKYSLWGLHFLSEDLTSAKVQQCLVSIKTMWKKSFSFLFSLNIYNFKNRIYYLCLLVLFFFFFFFFFFRATHTAYRGSQARGQIRGVAVGLHHSWQQRQIINPLSKARDRSHVFMDTSWVR